MSGPDQDHTPGPAPGMEHHPVVPDKVLEELLAAFGGSTPPPPTNDGTAAYDFDDPSIDRLLGIDRADVAPAVAATTTAPQPDSERTQTEPPETEPPETKPAKTTQADTKHADTKQAGQGSAKDATEPTLALSTRRARRRDRKRDAGQPADAAVVPPTGPAKPAAGGGGGKVIVIADDDQADAVYLDQDADLRVRDHAAAGAAGTGERSTIVIAGFDDHSDAIPARSASSSIDPRLRARRVAVRRAAGRRRLVWVAIVGAVVVVITAVIAVLASSVFDVSEITTQGNVYTDQATIDAVERSLMGKAILLVDTRAAEERLEQSPWVESARVTTDFPHDVTIDIRERKPIATFVGSDGRWRVIDRDGRVLAALDGGQPIAYMLITGTAPDTEAGQFAGPIYAAAAQLVIALPAEIRSLTQSVGVDATTDTLTMILDGPAPTDGSEGDGSTSTTTGSAASASDATIEVRLGPPTQMQDKLARLLQLVRDGLRPGQPIDVATDEIGA